MIDQLKQFVMSSNFVFVLITVGFIIVVALLLLENRRDNIKLRQLNAKIKDLIAGDYSEVVDMQGSPELTDMTMRIMRLVSLSETLTKSGATGSDKAPSSRASR